MRQWFSRWGKRPTAMSWEHPVWEPLLGGKVCAWDFSRSLRQHSVETAERKLEHNPPKHHVHFICWVFFLMFLLWPRKVDTKRSPGSPKRETDEAARAKILLRAQTKGQKPQNENTSLILHVITVLLIRTNEKKTVKTDASYICLSMEYSNKHTDKQTDGPTYRCDQSRLVE